MLRKQISKWSAIGLSVLVVFGLARAGNSHYMEHRRAFYDSLEGERKRLGLTDWAQIKGKYPTPEITLCHAARVTPGTTGEVAIRGKFVPGTKFLFENDNVEVVKENATATEYHATVRVPAGLGPGYSPLHVLAAVSGIEASPPCSAVYIGGKYEWDFTAPNGWRIKIRTSKDPFPKDAEDPVATYAAEFYRGNESQPFQVRDLQLGLIGDLYGNPYEGGLAATNAAAQKEQDDYQTIMKKLADPNLSDQERDKLMNRMSEAAAKQAADMQKMMDPNYVRQQQQKIAQDQAEFGCQHISFSTAADSVTGKITCGQKIGTLQITGTRRYVGP